MSSISPGDTQTVSMRRPIPAMDAFFKPLEPAPFQRPIEEVPAPQAPWISKVPLFLRCWLKTFKKLLQVDSRRVESRQLESSQCKTFTCFSKLPPGRSPLPIPIAFTQIVSNVIDRTSPQNLEGHVTWSSPCDRQKL